MPEIDNCSRCGTLFMKNKVSICPACLKEEEREFNAVYTYLRQKKNRTATMIKIVTDTGVAEDTIKRFIQSGRLNILNCKSLGYPCSKCGDLIQKGEICFSCMEDIKKDLQQFEKEKEDRELFQKIHQATYFTQNGDND